MADFERRVLRLVAQGKITPEEGEELLFSQRRFPLRELRTLVEGGISGVQRVVRDATEERVEEILRAEIAGGEPLEIRAAGDCALTLRAGAPDVCRVVWRVARGFFGEAQPPVARLEGRRLRLESHGGFAIGMPLGGTALDVYLPGDLPVGGSVMQRLGRVAAFGLRIADLQIDAQSGRVRVEAPRIERLGVVSRNGSIRVAADAAEIVRVDAWNGRVELAGALRDVGVTTRNGRISAELERVAAGRCHLRTSNGSLELRLDPETAAEIRAETVHGAILVDLPGLTVSEDVREFTRRRLCGSAPGDAGEIRADLQATNGSVRIGRSRR